MNFRDAILWLSIFNSVIKECITDWDCVCMRDMKKKGGVPCFHVPRRQCDPEQSERARMRGVCFLEYLKVTDTLSQIRETFIILPSSILSFLFSFSPKSLWSQAIHCPFCLTCSPFFLSETIYISLDCVCVYVYIYLCVCVWLYWLKPTALLELTIYDIGLHSCKIFHQLIIVPAC